MNLRHLQYFRVIAETEHITQAAIKLSITQPSLSHAISELEKELGTYLFEKQGRNIRLTKYGKLFLSYVNRALDELEKGEKKVRELTSPSSGVIDLAFIYTLGAHFVPALVQSFSMPDEHKKMSFTFHQGNTKNIIQGLKDDQYDIAFCSYIDHEPEIEFIPMAEQELVVITPRNHPLSGAGGIDLKDITGYPMVYFNTKSGLRPIIDSLFAKVGARPKIACEIEEDTAMAGLVSVGYGIAVMPRISALSHFDVEIHNILNPAYERFIYIASVRNRYLSPAATEFRNFAINYGKKFYLKTHKHA
ncbi:DNA-binding transcriptional LysR family regulator [Paenibacillus forsythiae]|uniref:DNA-binding transcriptional LysR family regulator n=1 Tax=Paenibacillus forsythiae TaxID=365616 RepID=A0ABU3H8L6_9BACL|nr:LysR family transcriptional regulator [Paenibacillus forsythiae]MDT3427070.1 DNA-binding transcriptional LysR family regulator [Paenibacillus forsythiae]